MMNKFCNAVRDRAQAILWVILGRPVIFRVEFLNPVEIYQSKHVKSHHYICDSKFCSDGINHALAFKNRPEDYVVNSEEFIRHMKIKDGSLVSRRSWWVK